MKQKDFFLLLTCLSLLNGIFAPWSRNEISSWTAFEARIEVDEDRLTVGLGLNCRSRSSSSMSKSLTNCVEVIQWSSESSWFSLGSDDKDLAGNTWGEQSHYYVLPRIFSSSDSHTKKSRHKSKLDKLLFSRKMRQKYPLACCSRVSKLTAHIVVR